MGLTYWIVALALPAIITAAVLFPVFAVVRFIVLRRHGEGPAYASFRRFSFRAAPVLVGTAYVVLGIGIFRLDLAPGLTKFIARGGLVVVQPLVVLDVVLGALLSPKRALALRQRERTPRFER